MEQDGLEQEAIVFADPFDGLKSFVGNENSETVVAATQNVVNDFAGILEVVDELGQLNNITATGFQIGYDESGSPERKGDVRRNIFQCHQEHHKKPSFLKIIR